MKKIMRVVMVAMRARNTFAAFLENLVCVETINSASQNKLNDFCRASARGKQGRDPDVCVEDGFKLGGFS